MAVVINEFEAVAEPPRQRGAGAEGGAEPERRIMPADLRFAHILIAARHARLRAH